jgi:regulatory protein YycI of two-component signal transduction system YycFG
MVLRDKLAKAARVHVLSNSEKLELDLMQEKQSVTEKTIEKPDAEGVKRRTKMIRYKTRVKAKLEGQALTLEFAEDVDINHLLGDIESFSIEFAKAEILRMKLTGKPK